MLKIEINKQTDTGLITAGGSVPELLNDIAILIGSICRQLQGADPAAAKLFRYGLTGLVNDSNSPMWNGDIGGMTGVVIKKS